MFSFQSRSEHARRNRLLAPAYSKSSICAPRAQSITRAKVQSLFHFLRSQTDDNLNEHVTQTLIPRNIFRALAVHIITAFALSETLGTNCLCRLRPGPNTMQSIGLDEFSLWNQDERDDFSFFESQPECRLFLKFPAPRAEAAHWMMERHISRLVERYDKELSDGLTTSEVKGPSQIGPYYCLSQSKTLFLRERLDRRQRASEILDHIGTFSFPCDLIILY